jgi:hypothetical protein
MTFAAAINESLIASITAKCGCDREKAESIIKTSRATAKQLGLTLAEVLNSMGVA